MNCTQFTPPSSAFITFYYYYSNFMLVLSLSITPLQFYIILTKSKNLSSFKWLILNHSFWCLVSEITVALFKPVYLAPLFSLYLHGLFRHQNAYYTAIIAYICTTIFIINGASLAATLLNRYLLAFPTTFTKWFKMKYGIFVGIFLMIIASIGSTAAAKYYLTIAADPITSYQAAIEYDPCMKDIFQNESGLLFVPFTNTIYIITLIVTFILIAGIGFAGLLGLFFIYLVKSHKSQTLEKMRRSLIISAFVQLSISTCFLFLPFTIYIGITCFQIPHTENIIILEFCVIVSHSFFESLATLYFVASYRKGVAEIFTKYFAYFKYNKIIQISPATQTENTVNINHFANRRS